MRHGSRWKDGTAAAADDDDCLIVDDVTLEPEVSPIRFVEERTGRLTVTDCLFERNSAKSMVFVYNDNALVNDTVFAENTAEVSEAVGFGRDNHIVGTVFTWASTCEGAAAEETGDDCLETGDCDGTCVEFTSGERLASRVDSGGYERYSNAAGGRDGGKYVGGGWGALLGAVLLVMLII